MESRINIVAGTVSAVIGGVIGEFFGGWDTVLYALLTAAILDYITGVMLAFAEKRLSSAIGSAGIFKKIMIFFLVGLGHVIDVSVVGSGAVFRNAVCFFYFANESLSILENAAKMGLPIPKKLLDVLTQLKKKEGEKTDVTKQ